MTIKATQLAENKREGLGWEEDDMVEVRELMKGETVGVVFRKRGSGDAGKKEGETGAHFVGRELPTRLGELGEVGGLD